MVHLVAPSRNRKPDAHSVHETHGDRVQSGPERSPADDDSRRSLEHLRALLTRADAADRCGDTATADRLLVEAFTEMHRDALRLVLETAGVIS